MMNPRVVFFGNAESDFSNYFYILLTKTNANIVAGINSLKTSTNPSRKYKSFKDDLIQKKIPVFEPNNINGKAFIAYLKKLKPDLFICIGYTEKLGEDILDIPEVAANFHASLLPAYRGRHPVFWALRNFEKYSGLSVHQMDQGIDTGDIFLQKKVEIKKNDTVSTLYSRIMKNSPGLIKKLVDDLSNKKLKRKPQEDSKSSYYSSTTENDFKINWNRSAAQITRWINITPGKCFTIINNKKVFLEKSKAVKKRTGKKPGTIIIDDDSQAIVAANDYPVKIIKSIQK